MKYLIIIAMLGLAIFGVIKYSSKSTLQKSPIIAKHVSNLKPLRFFLLDPNIRMNGEVADVENILNELAQKHKLNIKFTVINTDESIDKYGYEAYDAGILASNRYLKHQIKHPDLIPYFRSSSCNFKISGAIKNNSGLSFNSNLKIGTSLRNNLNLHSNNDLYWIKYFFKQNNITSLEDIYVFRTDYELAHAIENGEIDYGIFYKEEFVEKINDQIQLATQYDVKIPCRILFIKPNLAQEYLTIIKSISSYIINEKTHKIFQKDRFRKFFEIKEITESEWNSLQADYNQISTSELTIKHFHFIDVDNQ